ncbi:MAG: flagellar basal body rod protein FlgB [Hyphomicrobiaceae bacterium]|nr:flagellar basal body rod protein FlgB [Hyphomicrobiaceae bacterium]
MGPIHLFDLVSQHNAWLSVRQSAVAGNIANANTPGFKAHDAEPFEAVLNAAPLRLATTRPGHMSPPQPGPPVTDVRDEDAWDVLHSGNSVVLEQELIKAGEVNRSFALNAGIVKAFHRMLMASARG